MDRTLLPALLAFSLFSISATARPRDNDGDGRAPTCNQAAVGDCRQRHQQAATAARGLVSSLEPELASLSGTIEEMRRELGPLALRRDNTANEAAFLEREFFFLRSPAPPRNSLLGGRLTLEEFAALTPLQEKWGERYPEERARLLTDTISRMRQQESELKSRIGQIEPQLAAKNNEYQSALSRKNKWLEEAREHDAMCEGGCKASICPLTN